MDKIAGQKSASTYLFPQIAPFQQAMLEVGDGHSIYVEQCGNPDGIPVVVLHGGPGGGCSPAMRRYFDPAIYRVILFDQRGCGRSKPHAEIANNTTWDLVADIEHIRTALGIGKWIVFGGSWGATLALVYAITYPDRVHQLVLRGVFLAMKRELDWFYGGGAGQFWPELWDGFCNIIPANERDDLISAYNTGLFCGESETEIKYARAWAAWENALASIQYNGVIGEAPGQYALAFSRLENHYFINGAFLEYDGWIIDNLNVIKDIPTTIVQGRFDMICPPASAWAVSKKLNRCDLKMIPMAGHALSEPEITAALVGIMNSLRHRSFE